MKDLLHALRGELATLREPEDDRARMRDWLLLTALHTLDKRITKLEEDKRLGR